ncbi:MAG: imidazole glycerol phosphate synthase subunit HisH [Gemmatimonadota bacterium]|nr:imidazole glycerol phosphate synthase subunit HisH [Gemmatimonadota bacterium]
MTRIALLDYGTGNLHSLAKALAPIGAVTVESDVDAAIGADLLILPGVGAFGQAAQRIEPQRDQLRNALADGLPCIGVCLGMQLLFDASEEGAGRGIGLIAGNVRRLDAERLPQMGWNAVEWNTTDAKLSRIAESSGMSFGYYANAFVGEPQDEQLVAAWSTHENDRFPAVVRMGNAVGIQFHPEKSSQPGAELLRGIARELLECR